MSLVDHVLLTRFNLPTGGLEGMVRAREGWLRERMDLFERFCAPSVAAQQGGRPVSWIVYLDPQSPQWLLDRMAPYADRGLLHPVLRESVGVPELREDIAGVVPEPGDKLLTTNLDNDDGIARDFCARLSSVVSPHPRVAIYVPDGLVITDDGLFRLRDRHNAFCSVLETWDDPVTSWSEYHNELHRVMPVIELDGPPGWLQVVHGGNVSNRKRGRLVSPAAYRAAFAVPLKVPEPSARALHGDRWVRAPARVVRDRVRAGLRTAGLRVLGKDGYAAAVARARSVVPAVRGRLHRRGLGDPGA